MGNGYVEPRKSRHREEFVDGAQQLRIPVRRQWFVIAFLPFWLGGWTIGGISAIKQLSEHFDMFMIFWLGGWAAAWVFATVTLLSQFGGAEIVRVIGGDLEISNGVGAVRRTWRYRGRSIENLSSADPDLNQFWGRNRMQTPFFMRPKSGAVKFDYGSETVFLAAGVDEPEGRAIASWLAKRLPKGAAFPAD